MSTGFSFILQKNQRHAIINSKGGDFSCRCVRFLFYRLFHSDSDVVAGCFPFRCMWNAPFFWRSPDYSCSLPDSTRITLCAPTTGWFASAAWLSRRPLCRILSPLYGRMVPSMCRSLFSSWDRCSPSSSYSCSIWDCIETPLLSSFLF